MSDKPAPDYSLVHPLYLDVPMMVSFLAHLEGGVSTHEEESSEFAGASERAFRGRAGLRFLLPHLPGAELGAEGSTQRSDASTFQSRTERHHTAASLFNALYEYLRNDREVVDLADASQLADMHSGQLVEVSGQYIGNPLEEVLAFVMNLLPYWEEHQKIKLAAAQEALKEAKDAGKKATSPGRTTPSNAQQAAQQALVAQLAAAAAAAKAPDSDFGLRIMRRMAEDIAQAPVHDLLLETEAGIRVVLTVSSNYFSSETNEFLRSGEFRAVGKVVRAITGDRTINLTRRTVLGAAGPKMVQEIMTQIRADAKLDLVADDPIVTAPAIQLLPMAIFL
jgi:hypothetical protein